MSLPLSSKIQEYKLLPSLSDERKPPFEEIVAEIRRFAGTAEDFPALQEFCVEIIAGQLPYYNWVGFYMLDASDEQTLVLGPFRGAPTEHVRIPVTEGICGAAVAQAETVIVDDVSADPRYLACSLETRSEIVVPIRAKGKIVGEIDIDSHTREAFGSEDRSFLEECAAVLGEFLDNDGLLAGKLRAILARSLPRATKAAQIADAIRENGPYRWVGLYDVDVEGGLVSNIAWSGPNAPAHPTFATTEGLTSRAISGRKTVNVGEVASDADYLTALETTRSEIIVPILEGEGGRVLGTLDVESERTNAFDAAAQTSLEGCARLLQGFVDHCAK
jgi:L-methionine (R)-S-oxide reductase